MNSFEARPMTVGEQPQNRFEVSGHTVEVSTGTMHALENLRSKYNEVA